MPTFRIGGFKMRFYARDHAPAHVHCMNGDGEVVVEIETGDVRDVRGHVNPRDSARAVQLVIENQNMLLTEWNLFDMRRGGVR
jgi:Domain of unknown function (DUF4160)